MRRAVPWLLAAVALGAAIGATVIHRRNLQLQEQLTAARTASDSARKTAERRLAEAALTGTCRPYFDDAAAVPVLPLDVSIYFSLQLDCPSCIESVIRQWSHAPGFTVKGYTTVDGTIEEKMLAGFEPTFPIVRVEHMQQTLAAAGLTFTPAIVVSDPVTGRILLAHAPAIAEKSDTTVTKRLQSLAAPCNAPIVH